MKYFFLALLVPFFAHAAPSDFTGVVNLFLSLVNAVIPVLMGLAFLLFLWGIAQFIRNAADTKSHEDGKQMMIWGIIALFVMVSYLAIVHAAQGDVFGRSFGRPSLPEN
ncbi:MAG: seg [Parcubacteria group bacterium]|nr:seg [Parcubacteria group bacterium]